MRKSDRRVTSVACVIERLRLVQQADGFVDLGRQLGRQRCRRPGADSRSSAASTPSSRICPRVISTLGSRVAAGGTDAKVCMDVVVAIERAEDFGFQDQRGNLLVGRQAFVVEDGSQVRSGPVRSLALKAACRLRPAGDEWPG